MSDSFKLKFFVVVVVVAVVFVTSKKEGFTEDLSLSQHITTVASH